MSLPLEREDTRRAAKARMIEKVSYGLRNVEVYRRKMLVRLVGVRRYLHTVSKGPSLLD